jgi:hypothetical protein
MSHSQAAAERRGLWSRAAQLAADTPASRNRAVDFLRALSIFAVICGHWLLAAPFIADGQLGLTNLLQTEPWVQWLTWCFQVMPVFFLVGGYANGVSWQAALRDGKGYGEWLGGRLQRLIGPVLPLVLVWAVLGAAAAELGVAPEIVRVGSQVALVPIWFLAVYVVVVLLVPFTYALWQRLGFYSFWLLAVAAVLDDTLFFAASWEAAGWLNYAFVWLAVHQLGYAWHAGRFSGALRTSIFAIGGLALLLVLVLWGPYPVSMVSVPGEEISNTLPPKLPMLILGIAQSGTLLALEAPLRRWLARRAVWTATILVNGMIMTVYLWHITAAALVIGLALITGNVGLGLVPGSEAWWLSRPLWMIAYVIALGALLPLVSRFERARSGTVAVPAWRQIAGALLVCAGLALLALGGVGGDGWLGLRLSALALPFAGAWLGGLLPRFGARPAPASGQR